MQQKPGYRKRLGGGGGGFGRKAGGMDARTVLNHRMGAKPNFDVRSQLSSLNLRRVGANTATPGLRPFTVFNDHIDSTEEFMYDDSYASYEDPRSFVQVGNQILFNGQISIKWDLLRLN